MADDIKVDDDKVIYNYSVVLVIRHPSIEIAEISAMFPGLTVLRAWSCGDPRTTPSGRSSQSLRTESVWISELNYSGQRYFFKSLEPLLDILEGRADFIRKIRKEGGSVSVNINLGGSENIGDVLPWRVGAKIAGLEIDLGVEVFPNVGR